MRSHQVKSATMGLKTPLSLEVYLSKDGYASGSLYIDDGETYNYTNSTESYRRMQFEFSENKLLIKSVEGTFSLHQEVEKVTFFGYQSKSYAVMSRQSKTTAQYTNAHEEKIEVTLLVDLAQVKEGETFLSMRAIQDDL